MPHPGNRRRWVALLVTLAAAVGLVITLASSLNHILAAYWRWQLAVPDNQCQAVLEQLGNLGEAGIPATAEALGSTRESVARPARDVLWKEIRDWARQPSPAGSPKFAALASQLARHFPPSTRPFARWRRTWPRKSSGNRWTTASWIGRRCWPIAIASSKPRRLSGVCWPRISKARSRPPPRARVRPAPALASPAVGRSCRRADAALPDGRRLCPTTDLRRHGIRSAIRRGRSHPPLRPRRSPAGWWWQTGRSSPTAAGRRRIRRRPDLLWLPVRKPGPILIGPVADGRQWTWST